MVGQMICRVCPHRQYNWKDREHNCTHPGQHSSAFVSIKSGFEPLWCPLEPMILVLGVPMKKRIFDQMVTETGRQILNLIPTYIKPKGAEHEKD